MIERSFLSLGPDGFHRVAYTECGKPENRHVLMCAHGLSRNCRDFDRLAQALSEQLRVVCMDVIGRGDSDWLTDKSGYCFSTYLGDAAALIARVTYPVRPGLWARLRKRLSDETQPEPKLDWVGTSMGGLIGLLLAAKAGSPIRRLVLNDVGPFVPWNALLRLNRHSNNQTTFASSDEVAAWVREACSAYGEVDEAWWQHLAQYAASELEDGTWQLRYDPGIVRGLPVHLDPELPIGAEFLRGMDLWSIWDEVQCPVLVLRGEHSEVLPAEVAQEMRRRKPGTQVVEIAGCGHVPALANEAQIGIIRDFLLADEAIGQAT